MKNSLVLILILLSSNIWSASKEKQCVGEEKKSFKIFAQSKDGAQIDESVFYQVNRSGNKLYVQMCQEKTGCVDILSNTLAGENNQRYRHSRSKLIDDEVSRRLSILGPFLYGASPLAITSLVMRKFYPMLTVASVGLSSGLALLGNRSHKVSHLSKQILEIIKENPCSNDIKLDGNIEDLKATAYYFREKGDYIENKSFLKFTRNYILGPKRQISSLSRKMDSILEDREEIFQGARSSKKFEGLIDSDSNNIRRTVSGK